ncbi:MAG: hypothetical protein SOX77_04845 [Candidatus Borkfalkiaceae bacterium]|nr:hypothetical protein [Christensenellaceae bacterium]
MKRRFGTFFIVILAVFVVLSSYAAVVCLKSGASKMVSLFPKSETHLSRRKNV